ncbi:non-hydrolyzing UDP-N-acetylglucosamine 2-epimerase [Campylobacter hyointestinalis]|uniref:non-hydrolyzing UDP-N-acetylglucosamine 2-epimerase n=1 Tax=Campylobacter hyointestinalis TaxID=198 RepID=UPI0007280A2A|nr:UDP-N-acetylglucosamine 2-epimerase (non-hydrolyzing) [Campylobacter hyointestinalis]CUU70860.1 UDP-N-acetylglucosamine 2-epimerase [Campylobacter hyointestinalis subsp. hyointestinalis]CUU70874.1 UDP-N-acetylglucosamine 2-epimerase [Campylobacter hyointestinalis subsp. hyointestinalis]
MKKILVVFGTRPEAIKMAPLVKKLSSIVEFETKVCVTAQHRQMLDQVLELFEIIPDYDLNIMKQNQNLLDITKTVLSGINDVLLDFSPDIVLVHGDTTTATIASLAAFYNKVKVAHIEAGLRTNNLYSPYPEEANRQIVGVLANYHFAPTQIEKQNLIKENKLDKNIIVTGNTVIDALLFILNKILNNQTIKNDILQSIKNEGFIYNKNRKLILVTGHRRENFGDGFINICNALKDIALNNPNIDILYPVHLNPNVQVPVNNILSQIKNIYLINPLRYESFVYMMHLSHFIITDSGGIQEEAPSLGKPVLVMRDTTERPSALQAGTIKLVGTNTENIKQQAQILLDDNNEYKKMSNAINPYGDGKACEKIIAFLQQNL